MIRAGPIPSSIPWAFLMRFFQRVLRRSEAGRLGSETKGLQPFVIPKGTPKLV